MQPVVLHMEIVKSYQNREERIGNPLSPYAVTKFVNEFMQMCLVKFMELNTIGLRYFNVFGPKQSPDNPYAAVIPLFIKAAKKKKPDNIWRWREVHGILHLLRM